MSPWRPTNNKVKTVLVSLLTKDCVKADFRKKSLGQPCLPHCNLGICAENVQFKIKDIIDDAMKTHWCATQN